MRDCGFIENVHRMLSGILTTKICRQNGLVLVTIFYSTIYSNVRHIDNLSIFVHDAESYYLSLCHSSESSEKIGRRDKSTSEKKLLLQRTKIVNYHILYPLVIMMKPIKMS